MPKFYFTFGFNQVHQNGYHVIKAKNAVEARKEMVRKFGLKWAFQYGEKGWICESGRTQAEEYNLHEVK